MTNKEFIRELERIASLKTFYIKGGFGLTLNAKGKKRAIESYKENAARADRINALDNDTFGFDCCGLVKGFLWGFIGDPKKVYGGAVYKANGLDDVNESGLLKLCKEVSENFNNLIPGEFLYTNKPNGHCGIYAGNGKVIESTPNGKCLGAFAENSPYACDIFVECRIVCGRRREAVGEGKRHVADQLVGTRGEIDTVDEATVCPERNIVYSRSVQIVVRIQVRMDLHHVATVDVASDVA